VKFTEKGGVYLSVKNTFIENKSHSIEFLVKDTGIGVAPDKIDSIFEDFTQEDGSTTRKFGGTGLGLTISKKLIALMNGQLYVNSELGIGSEFGFYLTMNQAKESDCSKITKIPSERVKELLKKDFFVLLVEDNAINMKMAKDMLSRKGCTVIEAENGEIAVDKYKKENIDLIFMDIQMPIMNGLEATKKIREIESKKLALSKDDNSKIPIIALTANAMPEDKQKVYEAGMDIFLTKPIQFEEIYAIIDKYANKSFDSSSYNDLSSVKNSNKEEEHKVFDKEDFMNVLARDEELLEELIGDFFGALPEKLKLIELSLEKENREDLKKLAHNMKGLSLNMRFNKVGDLFKNLEKGSLTLSIKDLNNTFKQIKDACEELEKILL